MVQVTMARAFTAVRCRLWPVLLAAQAGQDALVTAPVGTGPFRLKEWTPRQRIVIERNPTYWGTPPTLDTVTFLPIPDASTRLSAYQAGDLDVIADPPAETVAQLQGDPQNVVIKAPATRTLWLGFNVGDPTLSNVKLRQAIAYAVDRDALVTAVAEGLVRPAEGLVPPEILKPNFRLPFAYDPSAARRLLAEAGYSGGLQLNLWTPEGRYLKDRQITEAIQQQLRDVGIEASIRVVEWGPYLDSLARHEQQLYLIGWGFTTGDPDGGLRQILQSDSAFNYTNLQDSRVDEALNEAATTLDPERRAALYNDLQRRLLEAADFVPIYHSVSLYVTRDYVKDFVVHPLELIDLQRTSTTRR